MPAYPLGVNLANVGQAFCQDVTGHLVAKLVLEFGSLALGALSEGASVRDGPCHDTADGRRDLKNVGDGRRVDQFVLGQNVSSSGLVRRYWRHEVCER